MSEVMLKIDGQRVTVLEGTVVATALAHAGISAFRRSVTKQKRGPLCGMGLCGECRVTINGVPHVKSCQTLCEPDMEVVTDATARPSAGTQRS